MRPACQVGYRINEEKLTQVRRPRQRIKVAVVNLRADSCGRSSSTCRFQKLDSCVAVMQSAQDCMCNDAPEAVDRAPVRRILSERNMRTPPIVIGGEFRKDPPQVLFVEHDQMIGTFAPDRPDQALNMAVLPGRAE